MAIHSLILSFMQFTYWVFIENIISNSKTLGWVSILALTATVLVGTSEEANALSLGCTVDRFDDSTDSEDTPNLGTLRYCLENVDPGGTIDFDTTESKTISISGTRLFLGKSGVTIEGPDFSGEDPQVPLITIQPASAGERILVIQADAGTTTTFKNLKFLNGSPTSGDGGAIDATDTNVSDLEIINSHFEGNTAPDSGGAIKGGDITITNSVFDSNMSIGDGGAIEAETIESISGTVFRNNVANSDQTNRGAPYLGGAVNTNELKSISNSTFEANRVRGIGTLAADADRGGAVYVAELASDAGYSLEITNSNFSGNEAGDDPQDYVGRGGAISFGTAVEGEIIISDSDFGDPEDNTSGNKAYESGGAGGAIDVMSSLATLEVNRTTFAFNEGDVGGAIHTDGPLTISVSTFSDNKAFDDGGAIDANDHAVTISSSVFERNIAEDDGKGGALHTDGPLTISGTTFSENKAYDDGGAIEAKDDVTISNSLFEENTAEADGGAIKLDEDAEITSTSFVGNKAGKDSGAIEAETIEIKQSFFGQNVSGTADDEDANDRDGGAIEADSVVIENSTFYANTATRYGGALSVKGTGDSVITFSTFVDNTAGTEGAAIYAKTGVDTFELFGNLFIGSDIQLAVEDAELTDLSDLGANVSTSAETVLDAETSNDSVGYSALGVGTPEAATLSLRPFVTFENIAAVAVEVTADLANSYTTDTSRSLPVDDQQGTTRTFSFFPGAEFIEFVALPSSDGGSTQATYSGPLVKSIGSTAGVTTVSEKETVRVNGERLSEVNKVFVNGLEGEVISTSADSFDMVVPEGLDPGNYDLEIHSSIGNLTYLDAFVISSSVSSQGFGEVSAWTTRISDTQVKVYVKYPTVGEKLRIGHQSGGSGSYKTVYVKTTASEDDPSMIVNEHGSYIVRTIDLDAINRIRVTVGEETMVQVRYNN